MGLDIKWTSKAEGEFDDILNYWNERNGSQRYSLKLINLFNKSIDKLLEFPESGKCTDNSIIRYKIVKDYFLYYSFDESNLYVVDICDMRRDPRYIKSLLD